MNPLLDLTARPVIAHRGNAAYAPENTLESLAQAVALGADALEFDVRLTRDGVPVVIHDASLYRTTGRRDLVANLTLAELNRIDAGAAFTTDGGATFRYRGRGLTVPTLEAVLERYAHLPLVIEVKIPAAIERTKRLLEDSGAAVRALVASTLHAAVGPFRGGTLASAASLREVLRVLPWAFIPAGAGTSAYQALCIPVRYYGVPVPVRRLALAARRAGVATHVWTINSPEIAMNLWRSGVQGIITDDPAAMIEARRGLA